MNTTIGVHFDPTHIVEFNRGEVLLDFHGGGFIEFADTETAQVLEIRIPTPQFEVPEPSIVTVMDSRIEVIEFGQQGLPGLNSEDTMPYDKETDFADFENTGIIYKGEAAPGTDPSVVGWRIRRLLVAGDDDTSETWANGSSAFDKVWNDRATYSY